MYIYTNIGWFHYIKVEAMQESMDAEAKDCIFLSLNNWLGGEYRKDDRFPSLP